MSLNESVGERGRIRVSRKDAGLWTERGERNQGDDERKEGQGEEREEENGGEKRRRWERRGKDRKYCTCVSASYPCHSLIIG